MNYGSAGNHSVNSVHSVTSLDAVGKQGGGEFLDRINKMIRIGEGIRRRHE